jgi:hypothetical protein
MNNNFNLLNSQELVDDEEENHGGKGKQYLEDDYDSNDENHVDNDYPDECDEFDEAYSTKQAAFDEEDEENYK